MKAWEKYISDRYAELAARGKSPTARKLHAVLQDRYKTPLEKVQKWLEKREEKIDRYLDRTYYQPDKPGSFMGPDKFMRTVREEGKFDIGMARLKKYMRRQDPYSLNKRVKRKFIRPVVFVKGLDQQWDADLLTLSQLSEYNDGVRYVLIAVDVLSRHVWTEGLPDKSGDEVVKGFRSIFAKGRKPRAVRTDGGRDFNNKKVKSYLEGEGVYHFSTHNETQANYAEAAVRQIKARIWRYLGKSEGGRYIDVLQKLTNSYNSTHHDGIGMKPKEVDEGNERQVWWRMYAAMKYKKRPYKFKVGQHVRISHKRYAFARYYGQTWSSEVYKIKRRRRIQGIPVYYLVDLLDEELLGSFAEPELQGVDLKGDEFWKIDEVLKERGKGKDKELYVSFLGFPSKFNQWISESWVKKRGKGRR